MSIRRFSQGLELFSVFFPKWEIKKIRRMLKRMMRLTSSIRDRDITLEFLTESQHTSSKHGAHQPRLTKERSTYQRQFAEMVRRWSARDFSAKWRNAIVTAGRMKIKPAHSAAENARLVLPKMARKYFEAGRKAIEGKQPPEELHGFRLETKRFRYTLELFRPLYGPNLDRYLKALRELQGALGKVSDYQAIQRVLSSDPELKKQIERALKGKVKRPSPELASLRFRWTTQTLAQLILPASIPSPRPNALPNAPPKRPRCAPEVRAFRVRC